MKLEETIQYLFDEYPSIFQTREDALNHLFVTIGNGFEWINGELVDEDMEEIKVVLKGINTAKQLIIDDSLKKLMTKMYVEDKEVSLYPLHDSCNLFEYPQDIKDDWLDGVKETVVMLLKHRNEDISKMNDWQKQEHDKATLALNDLANRLEIV